MSHSTTATSTYVLQKYSKSYPKTVTESFANASGSSEWQHFTNPVMRLVLDVTKASTAELESVRLRILWSMNPNESHSANHGNEVVFEDMDLLAFSAIPLQQTQKKQSQGLPLKAVYRDAVVGLRYLHPLDSVTNNPVYRRFQVTFASNSASAEFIDRIATICPCKANPNSKCGGPSGLPASMETTPMQKFPVPLPFQPAATRLFPDRTPGISLTTQPVHQFLSSPLTVSPARPPTTLNIHTTDPETRVPLYDPPSLPARIVSEAFIQHRPNVANGASNVLGTVIMSNPSPPTCTIQSNHPSSSSSLPPSSYALAGAPSAVSQDSDPLLSSVMQHVSVYGLSQSELEKLVGDVVREDGFEPLMEKLAVMWRVRGYLRV